MDQSRCRVPRRFRQPMVAACLACAVIPGVAVAAPQTYPHDPEHTTSGAQLELLESGSLGAATSGSPRKLAALALDLIKDFEAWRPDAYNDASYYCTIGYGHLIAKQRCEKLAEQLKRFEPPLTKTRGLSLLDADSGYARIAVQRLVKKPLSEDQFGALASFVFNVGVENFSGSTMLKYLNNGEYPGAAIEFRKWVRSNGVVLQGLIDRRNCEAELFRSRLTYQKDGTFSRDTCKSLGAAPPTQDLIDIATGERK